MRNDSPRTNRRAQLATVAACIAVGAALLLANPQTYGVPEPSPRSAPVAATSRAHATVQPDWTVAPCSLWIDVQYPVLPRYTYKDRCYGPDGLLIVVTGDLVSVQLPTI